jgi:LysM repeat protein
MSYENYKVTFSADGIAPVTVLLDETPANIASGYGGWTVVSRDRRVGLTVWNGKDPLRMVVPVLFDGVTSGVSQEVLISRLSRMALPPTTGGEPPVVKCRGMALPNPGPTDWVIENLQWGTNVIVDTAINGVTGRLRQDCVVNLLQYVDEDRVAFKNIQPGRPKPKGGASKKGWPKTYNVKPHDTLQRVAKIYYKNASKWHKIADANGLRDPHNLMGKKTLRIPAP